MNTFTRPPGLLILAAVAMSVAATAARSQPSPVEKLKDLPLYEQPVAAGVAETSILAVHLTGDFGYDVTDRELVSELARHGVPTVVLNSLHYFWRRRTPEESGSDLDLILQHYLNLWGRTSVVLSGYSRGADVLPFMVNRLSTESRSRVREIALISPGQQVDFEFHITDWFGDFAHPTSLPIRPEVDRLGGIKVLCFCGSGEMKSLCTRLEAAEARVMVLQGSHRMGMHAVTIADSVLAGLR